MKYFRILFSAAALLLAASCIDNDVPYPVVELRIAGVEGSGFTVSGISIANRTVALTLDEKTDIRKVGIDKVTFDVATSNPMMTDTESFIGQIKTSRPLSGEFDLRSPLYVTLSLYQDYEWTIVAEQPIERAFTVAGQIGATVIDAQKRTATAYVAKGTNLGDITVTRLKLGPADITTYSPTAEELSASGFETMRFVDATYHGTTERWTLHVEHTDLKVAFRETDLWNNTGVITAMVTEEEYPNAVIQYRVKGTDEWQATQKGERDETGLFTAAVTPNGRTRPTPPGSPSNVWCGPRASMRVRPTSCGCSSTETRPKRPNTPSPRATSYPTATWKIRGFRASHKRIRMRNSGPAATTASLRNSAHRPLSTEWAAAAAPC